MSFLTTFIHSSDVAVLIFQTSAGHNENTLYYLPCGRLFSARSHFFFTFCAMKLLNAWFKKSALNFCLSSHARAEPILTRMKEDHTRIILPAIDNIKYNTFEVQQYANAAHGYNWGLWCMYIIPPQEWLDKGDETAPIRWGPRPGEQRPL